MFETQILLYEFNHRYFHNVVADIPADQLANDPGPGFHPPGWILAHLAICTDYPLTLLGGKRRCPKEWHKAFGPMSTPPANLEDYPSKDELIAAYDEGHQAAAAAVAAATEEQVGKPHPVEILKSTVIQTIGDLVSHLMTTHEAFHISQLSSWRRQAGHDPLI